MIYHLLKPIAEAATAIFFRKVDVRGLESVPRSGPVLFAGNHPNTLMDALMLGLYLGRRVGFLGKSTLWAFKPLGWLITQLGAVPVFRRQDLAAGEAGASESPEEMARRNRESFAKTIEALREGRAIAIFPEGVSHVEPRLLKLKTGTARIALAAEEDAGWNLGLRIVPVGLNYRSPDSFDSEVLIDVGHPIDVRDYREAHGQDEPTAVRALTAELEQRMRGLVVHVSDPELDEIVRGIDEVYSGKLLLEMGTEVDRAEVTRGIADAVGHFRETDPERVERFGVAIRDYLRRIRDLQLPDAALRDDGERIAGVRRRRVLRAALVVLGAPVALYGWAVNALPYLTPRLLIRVMSPHITYVSTLKLLSGLVTFLLFYALEAGAVGWATGSITTALVFALSLPLAGFFALRYGEWLSRIHVGLRLVAVLLGSKRLLADALARRKALLEELDRAAEDYRRIDPMPPPSESNQARSSTAEAAEGGGVGRRDRVDLRGTELRAGDGVAATLERCELEGLRVRRPGSEDDLTLAAGSDVTNGTLDLANGQVALQLSDAGRERLGAASTALTGRGFELASSAADLLDKDARGARQLHLSAIGLRPAGLADDALFIELEHLSAEGITLHLAQADLVTVPWDEIESATLDLLSFKLGVSFAPAAVQKHGWLSGIARFESDVRRA